VLFKRFVLNYRLVLWQYSTIPVKHNRGKKNTYRNTAYELMEYSFIIIVYSSVETVAAAGPGNPIWSLFWIFVITVIVVFEAEHC
jgi:hypothetical protein